MTKHLLFFLSAFICLMVAPPGISWSQETSLKNSSYNLEGSVLGNGGSQGNSSLYLHQGTLGQPHPVGTGGSPGAVLWSGFWRAQRSYLTSPVWELPSPLSNRLWPNAPNPFNPRTHIKFSITDPAHVELAIFDVRGIKVRTLVNQELTPGVYNETWDGRNENGRQAASGVYIYRLRNGIHQQTSKMLLVK